MKQFILTVLFTASSLLSAATRAGETNPIQLDDSQVTFQGNLMEVRGHCGRVNVILSGIAVDAGADTFTTDLAGKADLIVSRGVQHVSFKKLFDGRNTVECVKSSRGTYLDVASGCSGAWCQDALNHHLISLDTLQLVSSPKGCGRSCVAKLAGLAVPASRLTPPASAPTASPSPDTQCEGDEDFRVCTWSYTDANGDVHAGTYDSDGGRYQVDTQTNVLPGGEVRSSTTDTDGNSYSVRSWSDSAGGHTEDSDGNTCTVLPSGETIGC